MKKKKLKKLQLSRETLHALTSPDTQKVAGGAEPGSVQSGEFPCCGPRTQTDPTE